MVKPSCSHSREQEGEKREELHVSLMEDTSCKLHLTPLTIHWLEFSHVITSSCKGSWDMQSIVGCHVPIRKCYTKEVGKDGHLVPLSVFTIVICQQSNSTCVYLQRNTCTSWVHNQDWGFWGKVKRSVMWIIALQKCTQLMKEGIEVFSSVNQLNLKISCLHVAGPNLGPLCPMKPNEKIQRQSLEEVERWL